MKKSSTAYLMLMSTGALLVPGTAIAQQQSNESASAEDSGNVIIVTARGRQESIQSVPLAITAFDAETIKTKNIQDLSDVARFTAGFSFEDLSGGYASPTIRGQSQQRVTASEAPVGTFLNGIYMPRSWLVDIGTNDLERIEIVKGPQSARYGRNAFAGAINYISPSADLDEFRGGASTTVGSDERFDGGGSISIPLAAGVLAVRASFDHTESDGTWTNTHPNNGNIVGPSTEGNVGGWNRESYSVSVVLKPTDGLRFEARYLGFDRKDEASPNYWLNSEQGEGNCGTVETFGGAFPGFGGPRLFCGVFGVQNNTVEMDPRAYGTRSNSDIFTFKADWDISDAISTSYLYGHVKGNVNGSFTTETDQINCGGLFNANGPVPFLGTLCNFQGGPSGTVNYDSHELRINYDNGGPLTAGVGGFYLDGEDLRIAASNNLVPLSTVGALTDIEVSTFPTNIIFVRELNLAKTIGVFGEVGYAFPNDATRISAELRYTSEKLSSNNLNNALPALEETFKFWTPRVTIEHDITPDSMVYVTVARGAKAGGFSPGALLPVDRNFDPEFNWTYELGSKNSLLDNRVTLNVAAFLTKWTDMQVTAADPANPNPFATVITRNLGNATVYGIELETAVIATDNLTLEGTLSYTSSTFDEGTIDRQYTSFQGVFTNPCDNIVCNQNGDIGGNDLQRSPSFMASFGAEWRSEFNAAGDEYFIRADVSYQDGFFSDTVNQASSPSRTLVNGRAGISLGKIDLSVWARNLFDEKYVSSSQSIVQSGGVNLFSAFYGERRTFGVTAGFNF